MAPTTNPSDHGLGTKKHHDSKGSPPPYTKVSDNIVALEAIRIMDPEDPTPFNYIPPAGYRDNSVSVYQMVTLILEVLLTTVRMVLKFLLTIVQNILKALFTITQDAVDIVRDVLSIVRDDVLRDLIQPTVRYVGWAALTAVFILLVIFVLLVIFIFVKFDILVRILEKMLNL
ncbi:hypothetical protein QBC33DRAFT_519389 [Phialemonium atrogriseum]|uniref:Uncharacterized protein n=1 Tax=Phialemonium atrogriseum TaxID=1093897 RepID=A0AAJ0BQK1_9PEZI|nr:uncharacterized protein QBC33DRAFT_519389 [Phialemonium atrogriseum]KAK1762639.1 hypothetical protein QBC33DRAFT_519389 [Phialemonium atrogriseum]